MARARPTFESFVAAHGESLLRTAHLVTMDAGEGEDLVQECLLKVAQRWRRVSAMDQPLAYARRVLVNLAMRDAGRRTRRQAELGAEAAEAAVDSLAAERLGTRDELWTALRQLTPRQRAILVLRYFHDLTESQVAEALGSTPSTISSTTSRSLARLRGLIEPSALTDVRSDLR